jgi:hypothetical protein
MRFLPMTEGCLEERAVHPRGMLMSLDALQNPVEAG